jgi:hypothetical protein
VLRDVSVAVEEVKDVHKDEVTGAVTRYMKLKVGVALACSLLCCLIPTAYLRAGLELCACGECG